jgi:serine/threonine protein kinase
VAVAGLRKYDYASIVAATSGFAAGLLIADDGMLGPVYRGRMSDGSQDVGVKLMREATCHSLEQFQRELAALGRCSHPHLVPMLGFSDDGPQKCIVYHYMSEGALLTVLHTNEACSCRGGVACAS